VKNEQEAQNYMNDISYNAYDLLEQIKELDSTGKKSHQCYGKERAKDSKFGSHSKDLFMAKTPPPTTTPIKINP